MKALSWALLGALAGFLVAWVIIPHAGRYQLQNEGIVKFDTATGQTWIMQDGIWHENKTK
jgi:hypothetical protein